MRVQLGQLFSVVCGPLFVVRHNLECLAELISGKGEMEEVVEPRFSMSLLSALQSALGENLLCLLVAGISQCNLEILKLIFSCRQQMNSTPS